MSVKHGCLLRKAPYLGPLATVPLFWLPRMNVTGRVRSRHLPNTPAHKQSQQLEEIVQNDDTHKKNVNPRFMSWFSRWYCSLGQPMDPCHCLITSFICQIILWDYSVIVYWIQLYTEIQFSNCISWQYLVDLFHKNVILCRDDIHIGGYVLHFPVLSMCRNIFHL